jgi:hypothetical protein
MNDFITNAYPEYIRVLADLRVAHAARADFAQAMERRHVNEAALTLLKVSLDLLAQARPDQPRQELANELVDMVIESLNDYLQDMEV